MALASTPACHRVLIFGHSYVSRLQRFCARTGIVNLGFPSWYEIGFLSIAGACLEHFEAEKAAVIAFNPKVIIIDSEGNGLPRSKMTAGKISAKLLVILCSNLEQQFCNQVPASMVHYSLLNNHLRNIMNTSELCGGLTLV